MITSLLNGEVTELRDVAPVSEGGQLWLKVYIPSKDLEGWILQELLITATPPASTSVPPSETASP